METREENSGVGDCQNPAEQNKRVQSKSSSGAHSDIAGEDGIRISEDIVFTQTSTREKSNIEIQLPKNQNVVYYSNFADKGSANNLEDKISTQFQEGDESSVSSGKTVDGPKSIASKKTSEQGQFDVYMMKSMREFKKYTSEVTTPFNRNYISHLKSSDLSDQYSIRSCPLPTVHGLAPPSSPTNSKKSGQKSPLLSSDIFSTLFTSNEKKYDKLPPLHINKTHSADIPSINENLSNAEIKNNIDTEKFPGKNPNKHEGESKFAWNIGSGFKAFRDVIANKVKSTEDDNEDEWEFWGKIVSGDHAYVEANKYKIRKKIYTGIPPSLRGTIWQALSGSNDPELESVYKALLLMKSNYSSIIERDTTRTFPDEERFTGLGHSGQQSLYNIVNAYSVFDPEIGYCQGIAFLAGILLLNISEEGAFCTLVKLMKDYNLRDLYSQTMSGLNVKIYQYDCLLKEQFPPLSHHLNDIGVKSSMYISQWFMTIFAYRFPIDIVFFVMDVLLIDGLDSIVIFSLAIISRSFDIMMNMDFEPVLHFLKSDIIKPYIEDPLFIMEDYKSFSHLAPRLNFYAKQHQKKLPFLQIDSEPTKDLQTELNITKGALNSMKKDFTSLNTEYMKLSKKCDKLCTSLERANSRADNAEKKLALIMDSMCTSETVQEKIDNDMLYAERLIKKNIDIVSENFHLKQKLNRIICKINDIKLDSDRYSSDNDPNDYK